MSTLFFRFPRLTVLTLFLVIVAGLAALAVVGRQEDPSLAERFGNIIVPFPGADAARVEALVTEPLEAALQELVEVNELDSVSRANIAVIDVSIREDLDRGEVEQAWTKIRDAVSSVAPSLPDSAGPGRPNYAQGFVRAASQADTRRIVADVQSELRRTFPDSQILALPFEQGPPSPAPIELTLVGPDLAVLDTLADDIRLILSETPGVTYTDAGLALGEPVARLSADEAAASLAGLRLTDLAGRLRAEVDGVTGGSVLEGVEELPVRVIAPQSRRQALDALSAAPMPTAPGAATASIAAFGDFTLAPETAVITRKDGERANAVYGFLAPYVLPAPVLEDFFARMDAAGLEIPAGYRLEIGGEAENQGEAMADLMSTAGPLLVLMVAAVVLAFNSFRYAGVIFVVGFLSVGLAMFGVWLFGTPLGFNAIVGSLGLVGLSINGSIVVLSALKANEQARAGDPAAIRETVIDATRHILATTLTTIGGFAPLLIEGDSFWLPFAAAVAGGVTGSAVLALVFAPAAFVLLARFDRPALAGQLRPA